MASIGSLLLAATGGAAGVINEEAKAKRDSNLRLKERMAELGSQQAFKTAETRYTKRHSAWVTQRDKHAEFLANGGDTPQAIHAKMLKDGFESKEIIALMEQNKAKSIAVEAPGEEPRFERPKRTEETGDGTPFTNAAKRLFGRVKKKEKNGLDATIALGQANGTPGSEIPVVGGEDAESTPKMTQRDFALILKNEQITEIGEVVGKHDGVKNGVEGVWIRGTLGDRFIANIDVKSLVQTTPNRVVKNVMINGVPTVISVDSATSRAFDLNGVELPADTQFTPLDKTKMEGSTNPIKATVDGVLTYLTYDKDVDRYRNTIGDIVPETSTIRPLEEQKDDRFLKAEQVLVDGEEKIASFNAATGRWHDSDGKMFPEGTKITNVKPEDQVKTEFLTLQKQRRELEGLPENEKNKRDLDDITDRIDKLKSMYTESGILEGPRLLDKRQVSALENRLTAYDIALGSLERFGNLTNESISGIPGAAIGLKNAVKETVLGFVAQLGSRQAGNIGEQDDELKRRERVFEEHGIGEKEILKITKDIDFMRGMAVSARIDAIYSLASGLKEIGVRNITKFDLQQATKILGSGSGAEGLGALRAAKEQMNARRIATYRQAYLTVGIPDRKRLQFGAGLMRSQGLQEGKDWRKRTRTLPDKSTRIEILENVGVNSQGVPVWDWLNKRVN